MDITAFLLADLDRQCREDGTRLVAMVTPDCLLLPDWRTARIEARNHKKRPVDTRAYYDKMTGILAAASIETVDITPAFHTLGLEGGYKQNDTHFNETGERLAAATLAGFLLEKAPAAKPEKPGEGPKDLRHGP